MEEVLHTICTRSASLLDAREVPCCLTRAKARKGTGGMAQLWRAGGSRHIGHAGACVRAKMIHPGRSPLRSRLPARPGRPTGARGTCGETRQRPPFSWAGAASPLHETGAVK